MHLDITFGVHVADSSSLVSILFREAFGHPYISFFHLLVNGFSVIFITLHRSVPNMQHLTMHIEGSNHIIDVM